MTQQQIVVQSVENATTKTNKPYAKVNTNIGFMQSWDMNLSEALRQRIGQIINVETTIKGQYTSIDKIIGTSYGVQQMPFKTSTGNQGVNQKKQSSFELSYAKDIFCALAAGYECEDPVKKDEMLRYYAELSADLILKMRKALEETNGIQEEEV